MPNDEAGQKKVKDPKEPKPPKDHTNNGNGNGNGNVSPTGLPGDNMDDTRSGKVDCYWDGNSGQGDDKDGCEFPQEGCDGDGCCEEGCVNVDPAPEEHAPPIPDNVNHVGDPETPADQDPAVDPETPADQDPAVNPQFPEDQEEPEEPEEPEDPEQPEDPDPGAGV